MAVRGGGHTNGFHSGEKWKESCKFDVKKGQDVQRAPIDRIGPFGRWLRHKLLDAILVGTPVLVAVQKYRTPRRDKLMQFLSFLGTEDFYTPLIVLIAWVVDVRLGRLFTILLGIGMYLATFFKNIFCLPRPPKPPVFALEKAQDWALPSLHSTLGVMCPWYIWIYAYAHYHLTTVGLVSLFFIIAFWSFSVMFSRVYLGVHSPADIVAGGILGTLCLSAFVQIDDQLYHYIGYGNNVTIEVLCIVILALVLHPRSNPPTLSYGDGAVTVSCAYGMIIARSRTVGQHAIATALFDHSYSNESYLMLAYLSIARLVVGVPIIFILRVASKTIVKNTLMFTCQLLNIEAYSNTEYLKATTPIDKHYSDNYRIPPIHDVAPSKIENKSKIAAGVQVDDAQDEEEDAATATVEEYNKLPFDVDIPTKFFAYTIMCWVAGEWCYYIFHLLGLTLL